MVGYRVSVNIRVRVGNNEVGITLTLNPKLEPQSPKVDNKSYNHRLLPFSI